MQCLSLFTMTHRREIQAIYLVLFENKLGGRLLEGERLLETIRYMYLDGFGKFLVIFVQQYKILGQNPFFGVFSKIRFLAKNLTI